MGEILMLRPPVATAIVLREPVAGEQQQTLLYGWSKRVIRTNVDRLIAMGRSESAARSTAHKLARKAKALRETRLMRTAFAEAGLEIDGRHHA